MKETDFIALQTLGQTPPEPNDRPASWLDWLVIVVGVAFIIGVNCQ